MKWRFPFVAKFMRAFGSIWAATCYLSAAVSAGAVGMVGMAWWELRQLGVVDLENVAASQREHAANLLLVGQFAGGGVGLASLLMAVALVAHLSEWREVSKGVHTLFVLRHLIVQQRNEQERDAAAVMQMPRGPHYRPGGA